MGTKQLMIAKRLSRGSILVIGCLLPCCALLDGYKDNRHATYNSYLTEEEKSTIANRGYIQMNWNTANENGTVLVTSLEGRDTYNFVEVGDWVEDFSYERDNFGKGHIKRKTQYDSYGNILKRTTLEQKKKSSDYYEREQWSYHYRVIGSDTVGLIQQIITFFEDGQIHSKQKFFIDDFRQRLSDRSKTKYYMDTVLLYNNRNKLIEQDIYSLSDRIPVK